MSSLADLPEVIGFFSYSRDDDESYKGRLSALRELIQQELGAQLGRSKSTFRLWQDKEAIAPGKLWEAEINTAVEQSVFFIPIITPRMVNSQYCQFEFDAFLARESALGRTDLIFPILYVPVPELENNAQSTNHPVLSAIARRQYVDWQTFRYSDVSSPATLETIARFCRKIVEALRQTWLSPQERARQEQAVAQARAEEARQREEAESRQRAHDEERRRAESVEAERQAEKRRQAEADAERTVHEAQRRKHEEAETRQRAEVERRAREVEAMQHAEEERALAAARSADTLVAVDSFLAAHPESSLKNEATAWRVSLAEREEAYNSAIGSDDTAVLNAFLVRYPKGKQASEIRKRVRRLGRPMVAGDPSIPKWRTSVAVLFAISALALAGSFLDIFSDYFAEALFYYLGDALVAEIIVLVVPVSMAAVLVWRHETFGGVEIGLYWLGCCPTVYVLTFKLFHIMNWNWFWLLGPAGEIASANLVTSAIILGSAIALAVLRRATFGSVESAIYWLGGGLAIIGAAQTFVNIMELESFAFEATGITLIVLSCISIALVVWLRATLHSAAFALYWLTCCLILGFGILLLVQSAVLVISASWRSLGLFAAVIVFALGLFAFRLDRREAHSHMVNP